MATTAAGLTELAISLQFVIILVAAAGKISKKLATAVKATLEGLPECDHDVDVVWPYPLAVRVQLALEEARAPEAALLGRIIDCALADAADGTSFQQWTPPPLPAAVTPSRSMWCKGDEPKGRKARVEHGISAPLAPKPSQPAPAAPKAPFPACKPRDGARKTSTLGALAATAALLA